MTTVEIKLGNAEREAVKSWLEALRSGNYKQGQNKLVSVNNFSTPRKEHCCLGVFADACMREPIQGLTAAEGRREDGLGYNFHAEGDVNIFNDGLIPQLMFQVLFPTLVKVYMNQKFFSWINDNMKMEDYEKIILVLEAALKNHFLPQHQIELLRTNITDGNLDDLYYHGVSLRNADFLTLGISRDRFAYRVEVEKESEQ